MTLNSPTLLVISGPASVLLNSEMDAWKYTISTYYHVRCVCHVYPSHTFQCHLCLQELIVAQYNVCEFSFHFLLWPVI